MSLGQRLLRVFLSILSVGYSPILPGTSGSAVTVLFLLYVLQKHQPSLQLFGFMLVVLIALYAISLVCIQNLKLEPKKTIDQSFIVMDEAIGMTVSMLPMFWLSMNPLFAVLAFALFRLFDITKPSLIGKIDHLHTPASVLLDDVAAGLPSCLLLFFITLFT